MNANRPVILFVEDELLVRLAGIETLKHAGFHVLEAEHGDSALAILEVDANLIDLLFTDVHMPGSIDGLKLAHHVSAHWPWIALLIASGHAKPHPTELPSGSRFLGKPYELDHVVAHVRDVCCRDG